MALAHSFKMVIVEKLDSIPPSDRRIYVVCNQDITTPNEHNHITLNKYPKCSCTCFLKMHNSSFGGIQLYVPCKPACNLFLLVLHADEEDDEFIHNNAWNLVALEKFVSHDFML